MFCDNCADPLAESVSWNFSCVPWNVASANAGESACLCESCVNKMLQADKESATTNTND